MQEIKSRHNPKVRQLIRLRERKERDATGLYLIEGEREVTRAVEAGVKLHSLFVSTRPSPWQVESYDLPPSLFQKVSYRDTPDGMLAIAYQQKQELATLNGSLFLLVEAVEKPGNLGAMLRTCDAVGVDGLILCDLVCDPFNPNVVRASMGALFTVPWAVASLDETLAWLASNQIELVAATPTATAAYWECDMHRPIAIAVGNEHGGLSSSLLEAASRRVSIPMRGSADSLNVATSAALLLYEALRQRVD